MKLIINLEKRYVYIIIGLLFLIAIVLSVNAYKSGLQPSVMGHDAKEIEVNIGGVNKNVQEAMDNINSIIYAPKGTCITPNTHNCNFGGWPQFDLFCANECGAGYKGCLYSDIVKYLREGNGVPNTNGQWVGIANGVFWIGLDANSYSTDCGGDFRTSNSWFHIFKGDGITFTSKSYTNGAYKWLCCRW